MNDEAIITTADEPADAEATAMIELPWTKCRYLPDGTFEVIDARREVKPAEDLQSVYARVVKHFRDHATTAGEEQERIIGEMRKAMENLTLQIEGAIRGGSTVTWNFNYPTRRSLRPLGSALLPEEHEHTGETIVTIHVRP
jgi:hypothetical protein